MLEQKKSERVRKPTLHVSSKAYAYVAAYAKSNGIDMSTAAERLLNTAKSRLTALAKYSKSAKRSS